MTSARAILWSCIGGMLSWPIAGAAGVPGQQSAPIVAKSNDFARGVNLSGAEFGPLPGRLGKDYAYPADAEIAYYQTHGFTIVRLPFKWERMQRRLYGGLDIAKDGTGDFERLQAAVASITGRGMIAILDPHNYGSRDVDGIRTTIGSDAVPAAALEDFWMRLANEFKANTRVWFNLMNEPTGISPADWKAIAQSVTDAIRKTGAGNRLLMPGTIYTTAASWITSGNAKQMESFVDPAGNFVFDVHQYLYTDNSGTHGTCVAGAGSKRLEAFTLGPQPLGRVDSWVNSPPAIRRSPVRNSAVPN
jgi:endoglucanase